jgi:O-methyltransferase involved in polyketide biosynthesis
MLGNSKAKSVIYVMSTESTPPQDAEFKGDLSVTALYTAGVWSWAKFDGSELIVNNDCNRVFKITNLALGVMRLFRWKLPKLAESLAQRHALIDQLVKEYSPDSVIELASGLSARSYRICSPTGVPSLKRYIEIDLPHVIQYKTMRLTMNQAAPHQLVLRGQDLKTLNTQDLKQDLVDLHRPVITAEGLMMYLSAEEVIKLLEVITSQLQQSGGRLVFDWVPTIEQLRPGIFGRCLSAIMRLFTGGDGFERDERTRHEMSAQLYNLGAQTVTLFDTMNVAEQRDLPFPSAHTQQLIFCADFISMTELKLTD